MSDNMKNKMSNLLKPNSNEKLNEKFKVIELDKIQMDPNQPRKEFDVEALNELADSISLYGVMTPIIVSKINNDSYIIRQGERRYRASLQAGKKNIPAIIDNDDKNILEKQLIENIVRENLSIDEISDSIKFLIDEKKIKKNELAKSLAKSNSFVSNYYAFATFEHELKNTILDKTQDLIIITELKRLLKNATNDVLTIITQFLSENHSINRDDLAELKKKLALLNDNPITSFEYNDGAYNVTPEAYSETVGSEDVETFLDDLEQHRDTSIKATPSTKVELSKIFEILNRVLPKNVAKDTIKIIKNELL